MQVEHNKFVPRLRAFERINAPACDRLKDEWECDPSNMARCTDAKQQIWEINDFSMGICVSCDKLLLQWQWQASLSVHTACSAHYSMRQQS